MGYMSISRGDGRDFPLTVTDPTLPAPGLVDLTGRTLRFTAKRSSADLDAAAVIAKQTGTGITHAADQAGVGKGKATLTLAPADTSTLKGVVVLDYDIQLAGPGGAGPWTTDRGKLVITPDLSRTTP